MLFNILIRNDVSRWEAIRLYKVSHYVNDSDLGKNLNMLIKIQTILHVYFINFILLLNLNTEKRIIA